MNILINLKILSGSVQFDAPDFFFNYIIKIIEDHPEHEFFIIGGTHLSEISLRNCTFLTAEPKSILFKKLWYDYKLPAIFKKFKIDVFVNLDNICSLKTKLPQLLLVPDISSFLNSSKKNTIPFLEKASSIISFSQTHKNEICKKFNVAENKITVIYIGPSQDFITLETTETEDIKEKYAEGKEYFLFNGQINSGNNLINLLKAFSFFKKRQKSNMQLVICTKSVLPSNAFVESLKSYKYRNEVKLLVGLPQSEMVKITASAYTLVFATNENNNYLQLLQAMQSNVPAIVSNSLLMNEICGDAVLYTDPAVFENIADKMMLLFKDENKRNELIQNGKNQSAQYSAARTSELLWQNIVKSISTSY